MSLTATEFKRHSARPISSRVVARCFAFSLPLAGAVLFNLLSQHVAFGAPVNYGTFIGNTVTYVDVTEDSNSGDSLPLFGAPTVSGDSLDFNPVGFDANSSGGGADLTDSNLTFMVTAKPGKAIVNISFDEAGDTTLAGIGTDATFTSVTADGVLNINAVDGVGISVISRPISLVFMPSGGSYGLGTDGGGGPFYHTQWTGGTMLNITQILTQEGVPFTFGATKISINIDNTLTAVSQAGTSALIAKKDFGGISITVNVPEPACLCLSALGLLGVVALQRRRRR